VTSEPSPCPREGDSPGDAPGPVGDDEVVIRFVPARHWLVQNPSGVPELSPAAFPRYELRGRDGKSVSVLRNLTEPGEIARRAALRNREPVWSDDPVVARAHVAALRQLRDQAGRREVCVNAHPVTDDGGHCPTHASILRSDPPPAERLEWAMLRASLVHMFAEVSHLSGGPVAG
jgi:hypothetical protein